MNTLSHSQIRLNRLVEALQRKFLMGQENPIIAAASDEEFETAKAVLRYRLNDDAYNMSDAEWRARFGR